MPILGDIKYSGELGLKGRHKYKWDACIACGKERWVYAAHCSFHPRCHQCEAIRRKGAGCSQWKGGRTKDKGGYVSIKIYADNFFSPMATSNNYVREHRLVMAKSLGRCLEGWEKVHHRNGIKDDNRIENLEIVTSGQHSLDHSRGYRNGYQKGLNDGRTKRIQELEQRIALLLTNSQGVHFDLGMLFVLQSEKPRKVVWLNPSREPKGYEAVLQEMCKEGK